MDSNHISEKLRKTLHELLGDLPPVGRKVIELRYGLVDDAEPMTFEQIAEQLSLPVADVEEYERTMMEKLRNPDAD